MATAFAILLAVARAIPAVEQLFAQVIAQRALETKADADQRLQEKDARVDAAIDSTS